MSSARFPGFELTDWRSRLVDDHPRLFPDAKPMRDPAGDWIASPGLPSVEDGWRDVVERLCRRLDTVAALSAGSVAIFGIDEKYAELRIRVACEGATDEEVAEVELAVELAEARSGVTCGICGERGGSWDHRGWLIARCDRHGEGTPNRDPQRSIQTTVRWKDDQIVRTARSYDWDRDTFVAVEPLEETE